MNNIRALLGEKSSQNAKYLGSHETDWVYQPHASPNSNPMLFHHRSVRECRQMPKPDWGLLRAIIFS